MNSGSVVIGSLRPRRALKYTRRAANGLAPFWNCEFSRLEFALLAAVVLIAAASHLCAVSVFGGIGKAANLWAADSGLFESGDRILFYRMQPVHSLSKTVRRTIRPKWARSFGCP